MGPRLAPVPRTRVSSPRAAHAVLRASCPGGPTEQIQTLSFHAWRERFPTDAACAAEIAKRRLQPDAVTRTDAFPSLEGLAIQSRHIAKITPPEEADAWLPWVHIAISNFKRILLGTYHGAVRSHRLQEYLDEFVYRFNRRFWEGQISNRLLSLCANH